MEPGGQLDMQQLFAAAAQMQSQLMSAQQELAETEIDGTAGGGLVKVTISGQGELVDLTIATEAIDGGEGGSGFGGQGVPGLPGLPGLPGFPGQPPLPGTALPEDPSAPGED